jgi:hypothetical protein
MALDELEAATLVQRLWPEWRDNRDQSKTWQDWALGRQPLPQVPDSATAEYYQLQQRAITPWLGLLVQALAQALIVEGFRRSDVPDDGSLWSVWQANGMDRGQVALYEAALTTGIAYVAVLPGDMPRNRRTGAGSSLPEWRQYSSAKMTAFYESPDDDWPMFAIAAEPKQRWEEGVQRGESSWRVMMFDESNVYWFDKLRDDLLPTPVATREHGFSFVPVVRYVNRQTITGRAIGEVEPYVATASRIDQDVFDRLVVQRFGAWRVRTATGLVEPPTEEEQQRQEMALKVSDILVSDSPDTQFGSLPQSEMDGHLAAATNDVRMLASVSQTPPQHLTGDLANISAEALAAIEASYNRKVEQRKQSFGESHEQCFSLSAELMGMQPDNQAQVQWRDMESRSLAQTADAMGKLAQMLEIPVEVLWDKVGFLTEQDRQRARELRAEADLLGRALAEFGSDT